MEIDGLEEMLKSIEKSVEEFDENASTFLEKTGSKLVGKVKKKTPVDTGRLRRSWQIKRLSDKEVEVFNATKYGIFIEYGHRVSKSSKVVKGRYMLTKSVNEIEKNLLKDMEEFFKDLE